jgi:hypothetical protein
MTKVYLLFFLKGPDHIRAGGIIALEQRIGHVFQEYIDIHPGGIFFTE